MFDYLLKNDKVPVEFVAGFSARLCQQLLRSGPATADGGGLKAAQTIPGVAGVYTEAMSRAGFQFTS